MPPIQPNRQRLQTLHHHLQLPPGQFRSWLESQIDWDVLLSSLVRDPSSSPNLGFEQSLVTVGIALLSQKDYQQGLSLLKASGVDDAAVAEELINLALSKQSEAELEESIHIREIILEWDSLNINNLLNLIALCSLAKVDWKVGFYTDVLTEVFLQETPQNLDMRICFNVAIQHLLERGYIDEFFSLASSYAHCFLSQEQARTVFALLHLLSLGYSPERTQEFSEKWSPVDLTQKIMYEIMFLFKGSGARSFSLLARNIESLAVSLTADPETQFRLLGDALSYYVQSSQHDRANMIATWMMKEWSEEFLISYIPKSPTTQKIFHLFYVVTFRICFNIPYITDDRKAIRSYQRVADKGFSRFFLYGEDAEKLPLGTKLISSKRSIEQKIRVGYLGIGFREHPVGFLSYQTLCSHSKESLEVFCYDVDSSHTEDDAIFSSLLESVDCYRNCRQDPWQEVLRKIHSDKLDILVYMDSSTASTGFQILPFRPAPIQMSWLGGDSPGIPEIDYFLVDPYILPEDAQADYDDELIRLPSFAAVDSFEIGTFDAERARGDLGISETTIVFWSAANAAKRSPDSIRAHLAILAEVPDSVLAIKGYGDATAVEQAYRSYAQPLGVEDKLRFITMTRYHKDHRAQLTFADLVLDTFPYTGATHTFEALYVGTPVLTLVGRHYYGRMSYSLLKNCQLEDCITHTLDDYIQRGIQLGSNREYLARVKAQVRASRSTSPIWDAKGFARSLEDTYRQVIAEKLKQA